MTKCNGFTLVELMVSVSILSILAIVAIPNFSSFIVKMRVDSQISQLHRLLLTARNTAINSSYPVVVCPLNNSFQCSTNWQQEISVFIDINNDNSFSPDSDETIIKVKKAVKPNEKLQYGLNRNRITFAPTGRTIGWGSNGTFKYCPNGHKNLSRGIVVATSGRFYPSTDIDHDGKDESRGGKEIVCRE